MSNSSALKDIITAARPLIEQWVQATRALNETFMQAWRAGTLDGVWGELRSEFPELWMTYYIRARGTGDIKIGKSNHVSHRLKNLWVGASRGLDLVACYPAHKSHEVEMKAEFAGLRLHGEWYRAGDQLLTHLRLIGCNPDTFSDEPLSAFPNRACKHFIRGQA